jgi:hypothetical protein
LKKAALIAAILAVLAASLATTACTGTNLYTGLDSNGGWSGATPTGGYVTGGIAGYPF